MVNIAAPSSLPELVRPCVEGDLPRLGKLTAEAFRAAPPDQGWITRGQVYTLDGEVKAAARIGQMGQFFGGRRVPIAALDTLMVAPEVRGAGVGSRFMLALLERSRREGVPLVTNYATTIPFYQRLGWEIAGAQTRYVAPIPLARTRSNFPVVAWDDDDLESVAACYRGYAQTTTGLIDRTPEWWREWILAPSDGAVYRYLVRRDGDVTGYVVYTQEPTPPPFPMMPTYSVACRELVWRDKSALASLMGFIAGQGLLAERISWPGPLGDPLLLFFDQSQVTTMWSYYWLVRIVDPRAALRARGYPRSVDGTLELLITDANLPDNEGTLRVTVSEGQATVTDGCSERVRVDIGTLGALYTGWLGPRDAARLGRLTGAYDAELDFLDVIFSGPKPWLPEDF